eukprot:CAMPEP_0118702958 /NCGR_PEP_ID=MMETSP0800-20121206/18234_1 /TAXON_ID=210618 ORGANISM="Striatella unipunctata, Strain CCMP2910" /NCGR_SAMPLE_ID=MMETSP0800 /ASSEMBLY_ACC=CAM_ASM_000638 /LENGTH=303 /DNA_ID=CAMNT_0006604325 /DNA_START=1012 /DNA_END=1920 /DNA_ORIENTATION=-
MISPRFFTSALLVLVGSSSIANASLLRSNDNTERRASVFPSPTKTSHNRIAVDLIGLLDKDIQDNIFFPIIGLDLQRALMNTLPKYDFQVVEQETSHYCSGSSCSSLPATAYYTVKRSCTDCSIETPLEELVSTTDIAEGICSVAKTQFPSITECEMVILAAVTEKGDQRRELSESSSNDRILELSLTTNDDKDDDTIAGSIIGCAVSEFGDAAKEGVSIGASHPVSELAVSAGSGRSRRELQWYRRYKKSTYNVAVLGECACLDDDPEPDRRVLGEASDSIASFVTCVESATNSNEIKAKVL